MLLGKAKLDAIEALISKNLIDSFISHEEFLSVNSVLREHNEMKKVIKNPQNGCGITIKNHGKVLCQL